MPDRPTRGPDDLILPFVFVPHGEAEPEEWLRGRREVIRLPAVFVPDPAPAEAGSPAREREPALEAVAAEPAAPGPLRAPEGRRFPPDPIGDFLAVDRYLTAGGAGETGAGGQLAEGTGQPGTATQADPFAPPTGGGIEAARERAFLHLLRWLENGDVPDDVAYRARYGGHDPMTDEDMRNYVPKEEKPLSKHGRADSKVYTAAGAYQITRDTWNLAVKRLRVKDFDRPTQDRIAQWLIARRDATKYVRSGQIDVAFAKLQTTWSSLPGAEQSHHSFNEVAARFEHFVSDELSRGR